MADNRLNVEQAAKYLGVGTGWLYQQVQRGRGPAHYRLGCRYQFDEKDLERFLLEHRIEPREIAQ